MRHTIANTDCDSNRYAYAYSYAYGNSNSYSHAHRDALSDTDVHAGTDNNTLRLE
jgi:hypothetical protein